jgi:hypothetical protein
LQQYFESGITFHHPRIFIPSMPVLEFSTIQAALTDDHPMRDADQFCIRELDARAGVPIIEQHRHPFVL